MANKDGRCSKWDPNGLASGRLQLKKKVSCLGERHRCPALCTLLFWLPGGRPWPRPPGHPGQGHPRLMDAEPRARACGHPGCLAASSGLQRGLAQEHVTHIPQPRN